ncbi:helix-turn-helix domain-containing protein [Microbacterium sp. LMC-P-041]|uniref:AraC-like ligand-binding domain-containing protein n=1 Tax=Microbacterium sp. LMC-P-041 TaxID=3040293 RepID=UPI002554D7DB|nr:helix-turn-helix domain-containing protein [Microbacterium sp. LMC-P-041]
MSTLVASGIDEWSLICSDSFVPLRAAGPRAFEGRIDHVQLGTIGASRVRCGASAVDRTAKLIAGDPRDDILLSIQLSGLGLVQQADRSARLAPGHAAIYEADREYRLEFDAPMSELVLQVPRARLRLRDAEIRDATAREMAPSNSALTVLRHYLAGVIKAGDTTPAAREGFGETALDLLLGALRAEAAGDERSLASNAILESVKDHLRRAFRDPDLSLDDVARSHNISRRYLDLIFAREGAAPASFVRAIRLQEACRLLRGPSKDTVAAIAYRVGFRDVTTFIRAFRREKGTTPESWRRAQSS